MGVVNREISNLIGCWIHSVFKSLQLFEGLSKQLKGERGWLVRNKENYADILYILYKLKQLFMLIRWPLDK